SYLPVSVFGLSGAVQIDSGYQNTCARLSDGSMRCWGYNGYGQLGNSSTTASAIPVNPSLAGVIDISGSVYDTCAALSDGTVRCFGNGDSYQLGNNSTSGSTTPVAVLTFSTGSTCLATAGAPTAETCHRVDDNCNGVVDDLAP